MSHAQRCVLARRTTELRQVVAGVVCVLASAVVAPNVHAQSSSSGPSFDVYGFVMADLIFEFGVSPHARVDRRFDSPSGIRLSSPQPRLIRSKHSVKVPNSAKQLANSVFVRPGPLMPPWPSGHRMVLTGPQDGRRFARPQ